MKVINKGGSDKTVIMAVREGIVQPFYAGDWLDLRVGWFLSICGDADPGEDDTITGLTETIAGDPSTPQDRFWIGVRNTGTNFPGSSGVTFIGYTNSFPVSEHGNSQLISSDAGVGTTNSDYWRAVNGTRNEAYAYMLDGVQTRANAVCHVHEVQNFSGGHAPGYSTLIMLRMTRNTADVSSPITTTFKLGAASAADVGFSSTPTQASLQTNLTSYPTTVQTLGPAVLSDTPTCLYWYWPFTSSRIRIHCCGIEKIL